METKNEKSRFGHLRSKVLRKPSVECPEIFFYRCEKCGNVISTMTGQRGELFCCNNKMQQLEAKRWDSLEPDLQLSYKIFGSLNENAIQAIWQCKSGEKPEWVWLRTFTGGQLKYTTSRKRSPLLFGLADEDAYAYCDKDPCVECTFRCKRGFGLYFYFKTYGLIYLPLDRMHAPNPVV